MLYEDEPVTREIIAESEIASAIAEASDAAVAAAASMSGTVLTVPLAETEATKKSTGEYVCQSVVTSCWLFSPFVLPAGILASMLTQ